jgi:uncharacterized membrane protein YdjX (TVP38/TMEM64 family)
VARRASALRGVAVAWGVTTVVLLLVFAAFEGLGLPLLREPSARLREQSAAVAAAGVSLLVVDAVLPVASSIVMVALGSLFGVVGGTALSILGGMGNLVVAAALGRTGRLPLERVIGDDRRRLVDLLDRYGMAAIIASRPIPLLAESTAIMAGATGMAWWRLLLAGVAGMVPIALVYAVAGDRGSQGNGLVITAVLIALTIGAAVVPAIRRRARRSRGSSGMLSAEPVAGRTQAQ